MSLRADRVLFTALLADLLLWIREKYPRWEIALDEGTVHSPRTARTDAGRISVADGVHRAGSRHHDGCAADLLLYLDGEYVSDGEAPEWGVIAERWESMHERARSGRRFGDANHVSIMAADGRM